VRVYEFEVLDNVDVRVDRPGNWTEAIPQVSAVPDNTAPFNQPPSDLATEEPLINGTFTDTVGILLTEASSNAYPAFEITRQQNVTVYVWGMTLNPADHTSLTRIQHIQRFTADSEIFIQSTE